MMYFESKPIAVEFFYYLYNELEYSYVLDDVLAEKLFGPPGYKPYLEFTSQQNPNALLLELIFLLISMVIGVVVFILINAGFMDSLSRKLKGGKTTHHQDNVDDAREEHMVEEEEEDTRTY